MSHPMEYLREAAGDELLADWPKAELLSDGQLLSAMCWAIDEYQQNASDPILRELLGHIAAMQAENARLREACKGLLTAIDRHEAKYLPRIEEFLEDEKAIESARSALAEGEKK